MLKIISFRSIFLTLVLAAVPYTLYAATGGGPAPSQGTSLQKELLDDFSAPKIKWNFSNGSEFPGAKGSLFLAQGHKGRCAALAYDFRTPVTVNGKIVYGHYVAAILPSLNIASATAITFWAKSSLGIELTFRVIDSTNQTLQYSIALPLQSMNVKEWYQVAVPLDQQHTAWGGAGDGILHFPIKSVAILAGDPPQPQLTSGVLYFNDVEAIISTLQVDLNAVQNKGIPWTGRFKTPLDIMGVVDHSLSDTRLFDIAHGAGFRWVRVDLAWQHVESKKGVYDFSNYDFMLNQLWVRGITPLFILDYGNTLYTGQRSALYPPVSPAAIEAWGRFVSASVEHFKGRGVHYEIWNEENGGFWQPAANASQYDAVLDVALTDIHQIDPQAQVISGGLSGFDFNYLRSFYPNSQMKTKGRAVGIHPYRKNGPETASDNYLLMDAIVSPLPPSITEWGYSSQWYNTADGHTPAARDIQAKMAIREILTGWLLGSSMVIYYDLIDDGTVPTNAEHNFGLVDVNYADKPAMTAIRAMRAQLQARLLDRIISVQDASLNILKFKGEDLLYLIWESNPNSAIRIILPPGSVINDMYGSPLTPEVDAAGNLLLNLNESQGPVYVHALKNK